MLPSRVHPRIALWSTSLCAVALPARFRRPALGALCVGIAGLCLLVVQARRFFFYSEDDAYIVARYARNLAQGFGLVFNPGEREWGCTTTLLPLLQVPFYWLGVPPVLCAKLLGLLAVVGASFAVARVVGRDCPAYMAALVALPIAAFSPLVLWAVGGLETALFAAMVAVALSCAIAERHAEEPAGPHRRWRPPASALWLLAATLTRVDAPLYVPALLLAGWNGAPSRSLRWLAWFVAGFLLLWLAHALYYQAWVPNTFLTKVNGVPGRIDKGVVYATNFARELWPLLAASCVSAAVVLARPGRRQDGAALTLALLSCAGYVIWSGGDWMPGYRFLAPVVLFAAPLLVLACAAIEAWVGRARSLVRVASIAAVGGLALLLCSRTPALIERLYVVRTANDVFLRVGAAARGGDPSLVYALADIGGFGWNSQARIVDLWGLTDHAIAGAPHNARGPSALVELRRRRPDVVLMKTWLGRASALRRRFHESIVKLDSTPIDGADMRALLALPEWRGDEDAAQYMREQGDFQIVNLPLIPQMDQYYVIAARASAVDRLPAALRAQRFNPGLAYYATGHHARGLELLQGELASSRYDALGRLNQSQRLLANQRPRDARLVLAELLVLEPWSAAAYNNLGYALALEGRFKDAIAPLRRAVQLAPDYALARNNLSWSRARAEQRQP